MRTTKAINNVQSKRDHTHFLWSASLQMLQEVLCLFVLFCASVKFWAYKAAKKYQRQFGKNFKRTLCTTARDRFSKAQVTVI